MRKHPDQPDLFDWTPPPSAAVLRFPVARMMESIWRPRVGPTARMLQERKTDAGRENGWSREIAALDRKMRSRGATDEESTAALQKFRQAVVAELARGRRSG